MDRKMMSRTELCKKADINLDTWITWQRRGLIPAPIDRNGRTLLYSSAVVDRLLNIKEMQGRGLSLQKIKEEITRKEAREALEKHPESKEQRKENWHIMADKWYKNGKHLAAQALELDEAYIGKVDCRVLQNVVGYHRSNSGNLESVTTDEFFIQVTLRYKNYIYMAHVIDSINMKVPYCEERHHMTIEEYSTLVLSAMVSGAEDIPDLRTIHWHIRNMRDSDWESIRQNTRKYELVNKLIQLIRAED